VQQRVAETLPAVYPLGMSMMVAHPQTGKLLPSAPTLIQSMWAGIERTRDVVAVLTVSDTVPDSVRIPAIQALAATALVHSVPSTLAVRRCERIARASLAEGSLLLPSPERASTDARAPPALVGCVLRPSVGTPQAVESLVPPSPDGSLVLPAEPREALQSMYRRLSWPRPLDGISPTDAFSLASIPGGHSSMDHSAMLPTSSQAIEILRVALTRNPSAEAAAHGGEAPEHPFTEATYCAVIAALSVVAAHRPALAVEAMASLTVFGLDPPRDLCPREGSSVMDFPDPVRECFADALDMILREAGPSLRSEQRETATELLTALSGAEHAQTAKAQGSQLPLWATIPSEVPLWTFSGSAGGGLASWGPAMSDAPPASADESVFMGGTRAVALGMVRGVDPASFASAIAKESAGTGGVMDEGLTAHAVLNASLTKRGLPHKVMSEAEFYRLSTAMTPEQSLRTVVQLLSDLPWPKLTVWHPDIEVDEDGLNDSDKSLLVLQRGVEPLVEWSAGAGGFACAASLREGVASLVEEHRDAMDALAESCGIQAAPAPAATEPTSLTDMFGARAGEMALGDAEDGGEVAEEDDGEAEWGAEGEVEEELPPLEARKAWGVSNKAFGRVVKVHPHELGLMGRWAVRSAIRAAAILATDPLLSWAVTVGSVPTAQDAQAEGSTPQAWEGAVGKLGEEARTFWSGAKTALAARESLALRHGAENWGQSWRMVCLMLWREWSRFHVGREVEDGADTGYTRLFTDLLERLSGVGENAASANVHFGNVRFVLLSAPMLPREFSKALCRAIEGGTLPPSEVLTTLRDLAVHRPACREQACAAVLATSVAWASQTRGLAVTLTVRRFYALAKEQVEAFAVRACRSLAVTEASTPEDEVHTWSPAEEALRSLETSPTVSVSDASRRCQLLIAVCSRKPEWLAQEVAPLFAAAPRQRKVLETELKPLVQFLVSARGLGPTMDLCAGVAPTDLPTAKRWEARALLRSLVQLVASMEQEQEVKRESALATSQGRTDDAAKLASCSVLMHPSDALLVCARALFLDEAMPSSAEHVSARGKVRVTAIGPTWGQQWAGVVAAPQAGDVGAGYDEMEQADAEEGASSSSSAAAEASAAAATTEDSDPGICRSDASCLKGDVTLLLPVLRGLEATEVFFLFGRLVATPEAAATRTISRVAQTLFSSSLALTPYNKSLTDSADPSAPHLNRVSFIDRVVRGQFGETPVSAERHRSLVDLVVRDEDSFPEEALREAFDALVKEEPLPLMLFRALALVSQTRGENGRRLAAALLDDVRRSAPWDPPRRPAMGLGPKRAKLEFDPEMGEQMWEGFVRVAKSCVPLSLSVLVRLRSARLKRLTEDLTHQVLVERLREWAGPVNVQRLYGITKEVLEVLGIEDTTGTAPSENDASTEMLHASGSLSSMFTMSNSGFGRQLSGRSSGFGLQAGLVGSRATAYASRYAPIPSRGSRGPAASGPAVASSYQQRQQYAYIPPQRAFKRPRDDLPPR
jgi:hypothetical protein